MPMIGADGNIEVKNGWVYGGGKWENSGFGRIIADMTKKCLKLFF